VSTAAPDAAIAAGIAYGTEHPVSYDISLLGGIPTSVSGAALKRMAAAGVVDGRRSYRPARPSPLSALTARADDAYAFTDVLRGWAAQGPSVIILDDPLRFDREARASAIRAIAARGAAVLIVSGRPAAMAGLVDRAVVMQPGFPPREIPEVGGSPAVFASAASAYQALVVARLSA
jgi:ABC-type sugar transport system ATPase subunit